MTREREDAEPSAGQVLQAVGDAAAHLGSFVSHMIEEQPATALLGALATGFVAGGGLLSPLGTRVTSSAIRATVGNVATLVALDLLRRALEDGGSSNVGRETARSAE
jgi:hypothetical protein